MGFDEPEPAIGATRDLGEEIGTISIDVLRGQAFESSGRLSYQPLIEALRPRIDQENAPDDLLHDVWLAELARLLPELRERYPDLSSLVANASVARNHLFEAVARLLDALAARTPLVLFLDDLHWADTAILDCCTTSHEDSLNAPRRCCCSPRCAPKHYRLPLALLSGERTWDGLCP